MNEIICNDHGGDYMNKDLKGQCHEIFCFRFFSWITFPQAPDNNNRIISNFFKNSRRYSQVKVHHRCQRHRWQICHRCQWHRWQISAGINVTGGKFATGINDTTGVVDTGGKPWAANISANFRKKFETVLMEYSGAGGKLIHEKNQKQKISWHCPFKSW